MNAFGKLVGRQIRSDLRSAWSGFGARLSPDRRALRAESIGDLREEARRAVPKAIFDFVDGAADDEISAAANQADLQSLRLLPRMLTDVSSLDHGVTVLGQPIAIPVMGAPTGLSGLAHPRGELGVAKALHDAGSVYVVAGMSSYSLEEVSRAAPERTWLQIYAWKDRGLVADLLERARDAGLGALVVTVDVPQSARRPRDLRNGFAVPPRVTLRSAFEGVRHPRWTANFIREPRFAMANLVDRATAEAADFDAVGFSKYASAQFDPAWTWADVEWLRQRWDRPLVVKGVLRADDAEQAAARGADAVVVSNHGGRQLDQAQSSIRALPAIADRVGSETEVYLDSGIRRGSDVLKALALGARACLVGRPLLYGLAASGDVGAARAVDLLREELRLAMSLAGVPSLDSVDRTLLAEER